MAGRGLRLLGVELDERFLRPLVESALLELDRERPEAGLARADKSVMPAAGDHDHVAGAKVGTAAASRMSAASRPTPPPRRPADRWRSRPWQHTPGPRWRPRGMRCDRGPEWLACRTG